MAIHSARCNDWKKYLRRKQITYEQIKFVRQNTTLPLAISAENMYAPLTVAFGNEKSDPQFQLWGSDENYGINHNRDIAKGRMLTAADVQYARDVTVLGQDIVDRVFKHGEDPINETVRMNGSQLLGCWSVGTKRRRHGPKSGWVCADSRD